MKLQCKHVLTYMYCHLRGQCLFDKNIFSQIIDEPIAATTVFVCANYAVDQTDNGGG